MKFFTIFIVMIIVITMVAGEAPMTYIHSYPVQPGTTGQSGLPGQPKTPGTPISGYYPGQPRQPGTPGQLGVPVMYSQPGYYTETRVLEKLGVPSAIMPGLLASMFR